MVELLVRGSRQLVLKVFGPRRWRRAPNTCVKPIGREDRECASFRDRLQKSLGDCCLTGVCMRRDSQVEPSLLQASYPPRPRDDPHLAWWRNAAHEEHQ